MLSCVFFINCEKYVTNSGFEEIVYQARTCSLGRIKTVLSGNSCNMCWRIHEVVAKVNSRLFQEKYVAPLISDKLFEQSKSDQTTLQKLQRIWRTCKIRWNAERCSAGEFGVKVKYWILYVRIIYSINQLNFVININDYYLGLETWEELMVLSFTMNKQNYAQYDTY